MEPEAWDPPAPPPDLRHFEGLSKFGNPLPEYNPATDPYREPDPVQDTRANAPSSTPLMTSWARVGVLCLVAAVLLQRRRTQAAGGGMVEGIDFPDEIKIHGIRQSFVGGGRVGLASVAALYIAPGSASARTLSPFAGSPPGELKQAGFFEVLAEVRMRQSLLLQWTAPMEREEVVDLFGRAAGPAHEALTSALRPLLGMEVPAGADLFLTCSSGELYLAFAGTPSAHVRNMAPVGATVRDVAACPALFTSFLSHELLQLGVAEGYAERFAVWT
ncbi:hypothetical protein AB1Y20_002284 [Prymnesium parvum]|uniref:Chalcone isomerase domain-containing protein n=1 Tax=Prymnesium parvum TaxID=97485 RepID=A0AB34J8N8_PRYPA